MHVVNSARRCSIAVAYFQQFSGDFEPIFSLLDDLSAAISRAMKATHSKLQSKVSLIVGYKLIFNINTL